MAHPLIVKYQAADFATLSPSEQAEGRAEIKALLDASKTKLKGTGLTANDRILLLKIWIKALETQEAPPEQADSAPLTASSTKAAKKAAKPAFYKRFKMPELLFLRAVARAFTILTRADLIFLLILVSIGTSVVYLGGHGMHEASRIEEVKREAEALAAWIKEAGDQRATAAFEPEACRKDASGTATWKDCAAALVGTKGPAAGKLNRFDEAHPLLAAKCDGAEATTIGGIVIEKGSYPPGTASLAYVSLDGAELMNQVFTFRISICGRGYHMIKVAGEVAF